MEGVWNPDPKERDSKQQAIDPRPKSQFLTLKNRKVGPHTIDKQNIERPGFTTVNASARPLVNLRGAPIIEQPPGRGFSPNLSRFWIDSSPTAGAVGDHPTEPVNRLSIAIDESSWPPCEL